MQVYNMLNTKYFIVPSQGKAAIQQNPDAFGNAWFVDSLVVEYGSPEALQSGWVSYVNFDPHIGQRIFTDMTEACGGLLDVRREAVVTDVKAEDGDWLVSWRDSLGKRHSIKADVLIDATELGDIAKACGVDYRIGMEASSETGESIAPVEANDVIQDLTFVAFQGLWT